MLKFKTVGVAIGAGGSRKVLRFERHRVISALEVIEPYLNGTLTLHVHYAPGPDDRELRSSACALVWSDTFPSPSGFGPVTPSGSAAVHIVQLADGGRARTVAAIPSLMALGQRNCCMPRHSDAGALCLVAPDFVRRQCFASLSGELTFRRNGSGMLVPRGRASLAAHLQIMVAGVAAFQPEVTVQADKI